MSTTTIGSEKLYRERVNKVRSRIDVGSWWEFRKKTRVQQLEYLANQARNEGDMALHDHLQERIEQYQQRARQTLAEGGDLESRAEALEKAYKTGPNLLALFIQIISFIYRWLGRNKYNFMGIASALIVLSCASYIVLYFFALGLWIPVVIMTIGAIIGVIAIWYNSDYAPDLVTACGVFVVGALVLSGVFRFVGTPGVLYFSEKLYEVSDGKVLTKHTNERTGENDKRDSAGYMFPTPRSGSVLQSFDTKTLNWALPTVYDGKERTMFVELVRTVNIEVGDQLTLTPEQYEQETNHNVAKLVGAAAMQGNDAVGALREKITFSTDLYKVVATVKVSQ
ncbi:hypothetical protein IPM19_00455 [bacterium]|nr:MAG: hypothetical protein IPM19_00455 [bacterium]